MKVILLKDVKGSGKAGDTINAADGTQGISFSRTVLLLKLPQKTSMNSQERKRPNSTSSMSRRLITRRSQLHSRERQLS